VEAIITEIRAEERRMIVSLRRAARERERKRVREYMQSQEDEGRVTIGDLAGELLRQVVERPKVETAETSDESPEPESPEPRGEVPRGDEE